MHLKEIDSSEFVAHFQKHKSNLFTDAELRRIFAFTKRQEGMSSILVDPDMIAGEFERCDLLTAVKQLGCGLNGFMANDLTMFVYNVYDLHPPQEPLGLLSYDSFEAWREAVNAYESKFREWGNQRILIYLQP